MKIKIILKDNENNPHKILVLIIIIFILGVVITSAISHQWIPIQQISKDESGLIPIDIDNNGIIDDYSYGQSTYSVVANLSGGVEYISGKQLYWTVDQGIDVLCINDTANMGYCTGWG